MQLNLEDETLIHHSEEQQEYITVQRLLDRGLAIVVPIERFGQYLLVFHNGQTLAGLGTTQEVADAYGATGGWIIPAWKAAAMLAASVLISQIAVYFVADFFSWPSMWWRPLLATAIVWGLIHYV